MNIFQRQIILGNGRALAEQHNIDGGPVPIASPRRAVTVGEFEASREAPCCDGPAIDGVHNEWCATNDSVYRCEECDLPFQRMDANVTKCEFCRGWV